MASMTDSFPPSDSVPRRSAKGRARLIVSKHASAFMCGMGTSLDLFGVARFPSTKLRIYSLPVSPDRKDAIAVGTDWHAVGSDLALGMKQVAPPVGHAAPAAPGRTSRTKRELIGASGNGGRTAA